MYRFLEMPSESDIIQRIQRAIPSRSPALRLGIGDDAALFRPSPGKDMVLTCDAFLEGSHFLRDRHPPDSVGYKSLARATSDLAAMGARPRCFLLSLALPASLTGRWLDRFLSGMARAARKFSLVLAGGDTSKHSRVVLNFTVFGEVAPGSALRRSGAKAGDILFVSGTLGAAQLGLQLIRARRSRTARWGALLPAHLYPQIRLELGQWLSRTGHASAAIDISDGLSTDLTHLCEASSVGARIFQEAIPAVRVPPALRSRGFDSLRLAMHGGDDYELLFTVPRRNAAKIPSQYLGVRLTPIGEIVRGKKIDLWSSDRLRYRLSPQGWDHFRQK